MRENTKILMFDGNYKFCQDIKIGDILMSHDSTPTQVMGLSSKIDETQLLAVFTSKEKSDEEGVWTESNISNSTALISFV